jgi:outer membrane autotransporter protein
VTLRASAGWRHAAGDVTPLADLSIAGSDPFTVAGVPIARDSAVFEAGLDIAFTPNAKGGFTYTGQFANGIVDQSVKGSLMLQF